jgi:hypothetical protein
MYIPPTVPGMVLANGNVGVYLDDEDLSTWLSMDNGFNWRELAKGVNIYEVSLTGDVIIFAIYGNVTDVVYITYGGDEITPITLEKPMLVHNIITSSTGFICYGGSMDQGQIVEVHIPSTNIRRCIGETLPTSEGSDYTLIPPPEH